MLTRRILTLLGLLTITTLLLAMLSGGSTFIVAQGPPAPPVQQGSEPASTDAAPDLVAASRIRLVHGEFDPLATPELAGLPRALLLTAYPGDGTGYYLVQFRGPITTSDMDALTRAGTQVFDYIPDFTFIVKMDGAARSAVVGMKQVRWVGLYQPTYRLPADLLARTYDSIAAPDPPHPDDGRQSVDPDALWDPSPLEVVVSIFRGEELAPITTRIQALGGVILDQSHTEWKSKLKISVSPRRLTDLAAIPGVRWIEEAPEWKLDNSKAADIMDVRNVWNTHGLRGNNQTIGIADTGLDQGSTDPALLHDDFENGSGASRVMVIHDQVGDGGNDTQSGHGTHVAGSVLGNGALSGSNPSAHIYPNTAYVGMAPEANLVFQAVENNSTGDLDGIPLDLNTLFAQAAASGANLHTDSWGSSVMGMYTTDSEDVDEYVWDNKTFAILFSAGNSGVDNNADGVIDLYSLGSPATAKNAITVGATENERPSGSTPAPGFDRSWGSGSGTWSVYFSVNPVKDDHVSNNPSGMAAFSSRGSTLDGRYKPDIVAPGTNIVSTRSHAASGTGWGAIDANYMFNGGTSMSTPLTAGAAALVRQYYTDDEHITPSAALIKATLANGATNIAPGQYGTGSTQEIPDTRPNNVAGWGRVNVESSIFPTAPRVMRYVDETTGLQTGTSHTYNYSISSAAEPLRVTLAWSDYPGSPAAAGGLVNDLDLQITGPGGVTYYPNNASQRGVSQHLTYDDGVPTDSYYWGAGVRVAVCFTPTSYPAILQTALFNVGVRSGGTYPKTFNWYVYSGNCTTGPSTVQASGSTTIRGLGWHPVDLSSAGVTISSGDFFLALALPDSYLVWRYDASAPVDGRSWDYSGGSWSRWTTNDYMFNAIVKSADFSTNHDRVNNLVGIDIANPAPGTYAVTVSGYNVPHGPQPYALLVSGAIEAPGTGTPTPPNNLTATPVSQTRIDLAWTDNSNNESGFKIERSPNGTSDWTQIATVGANVTTYSDTGLTCATTYYYRVRAYNAGGDSSYSNTANATTLACTPQTYTISGYVRTTEGSGISGVVMNGLPGNPATDGSGFYSAQVAHGWSGTVTPQKTGYSFSPPSRSYTNVTSDQTDQNYIGVRGQASCLPAPLPRTGSWTSFYPYNDVRALAWSGNTLWAGTSGGLLRWNTVDESFARYSEEDGLASEAARALALDDAGNLWVGTNGGLSVFDGNTWATFHTGNSGLVSNDISALVIDSQGNKWIATYGGVSVVNDNGTPFNRADDTWVTFTATDGLAGSAVFDLALDGAGRAWFATWTPVLFGYEARGATLLDYHGTPFDKGDDTWVTFRYSNSGLAHDGVYTLATEGANLVWFGTASGGAYVLDHRGTPDRGDDVWANFTSDDGLAHDSVEVLALDSASRKWFGIGRSGYGVSLLDDGDTPFDKTDDVWVTFTSADGLADDSVKAILPTETTRLWFGFVSHQGVSGLNHQGTPFAKADDTWTTYRADDGPGVGVNALAVDGMGYIWTGTDEGISLLDDKGTASRRDDRWLHFTTADGLATDTVTTLAVDDAGRVWAGNESPSTAQGVSVLDTQGTPFDKSDDIWVILRQADGLPDNAIKLIIPDGGNVVWFIPWSFNAAALDHQGTLTDKSDDIWQTFTTSDGMAGSHIGTLVIRGRHKWFGHVFNGVSHLDDGGTPLNKVDDVWVIYSESDGLPYRGISAIAVDCAGRAWFGNSVFSNGVSILDDQGTPSKDDDLWVTHTEADGLADNDVNIIATTGSNQVWFGRTGQTGISLLDNRDTLDKGDDIWATALPNTGWRDVQHIVFDAQGRAWVAPEGGVMRFTPCPDFVDPAGVGVGDIQYVAARWREPAVGQPYDLDRNGVINIVDIMKVAAAWGACP